MLHYGAFVPLNVSPAPPQVAGLTRLEEDEDVTDPNQAWKRSLTANATDSNSATSFQSPTVPNRAGRSSAPGRSSSLAPEADEDTDSYARASFEDAPAMPRRGVSPLLVGLLALTALAEAVGLYLFWNGQLKPKQDNKPTTPAQTVEIKPTDKPLIYKNPVLLYTKPNLWEGVLQVMPDGRLLVVNSKNQEIAVSPGGTATPLPLTDIQVPALLKPVIRRDGTLKPVPIYLAIAMDANGYRYELNTQTKAIDKYNPSGILVLAGIGKGKLKTPANLAVDKQGNLYVIDGNRLKVIQAIPDTGQAASMPGVGAANQVDTLSTTTGQGAAGGAFIKRVEKRNDPRTNAAYAPNQNHRASLCVCLRTDENLNL